MHTFQHVPTQGHVHTPIHLLCALFDFQIEIEGKRFETLARIYIYMCVCVYTQIYIYLFLTPVAVQVDN